MTSSHSGSELPTIAFRKDIVKIPSQTRGWDLDTWCYFPSGLKSRSAQPCPVIVMAPGLSANKTMGIDAYAAAFAAEGYACVVFDYRRWGTSDGSPRHTVFISEQLEDYRTVIKYCRLQPEFDPQRVVIWGTSFSGGHAITLAAEGRLNLACAIAQCPYMGEGPPISLSFALGGHPVYMSAVGRPGTLAAMTVDGSVEGFLELNGNFPNQISASSVLEIPFYNPSTGAASITAPTLLLPTSADALCPWKTSPLVKTRLKKVKVIEIPGDHFEVYPRKTGHPASLQAQIAFLKEHVPV